MPKAAQGHLLGHTGAVPWWPLSGLAVLTSPVVPTWGHVADRPRDTVGGEGDPKFLISLPASQFPEDLTACLGLAPRPRVAGRFAQAMPAWELCTAASLCVIFSFALSLDF